MAKDSEKDERQGVTVGFAGGAGLALRLTADDAAGLLKALGGDGWHEVQDADGSVRLDLSQVVFVRTERSEHRVGFGLG